VKMDSSPAAGNRPPPSPVRSPGMNHREALTRGLEDFQRMLSEVRQSNGVLTEQLKQFEGSLEDVRATNDHLGRQLTDFGERLHTAKQEEDDIAAELKRFSERLAIAKANLEGDLFRTRTSPHGAPPPSFNAPAISGSQPGLGLTSSALNTFNAAQALEPRAASPTSGVESSSQDVKALLEQHHDTLRWIHSRYSVVGEIAIDQAFSVSKLQFWRFACDAGLLPNNAPRHEIDAVFNNVVRDLGEGSNVTMAYPAFLEAVCQLAGLKYRHGSSYDQLNSFLSQDVLPIADASSDPFRELVARPGPQGVFAKHRARLMGIFRHYARLDASSNDAVARQSTINLREFITLMRECDAIDRSLSMQAIMEIFVQSNVDVDSQDNLDTEFIYPEFVEAMARCADSKIPGRAPLADKLEQFLTNTIFPSAQNA